MVKYRRLTIDELESLETEFVRYLAAQSIPADDWVRIKENDKDRESELIDLFSDVVIAKSIINVKYLEQRTTKRLLCYQVNEDNIALQGLELVDDNDNVFDFKDEFLMSDLVSLFEDPDIDISFISGTKKSEEIKSEVFDLIEEGAMISIDNTLYNFITTLKQYFSE